MNEQQELKSFDPKQPCKTRNGYSVLLLSAHVGDKLLGFIFTEDGSALMSEWGLDGKRKTIYPRKTNEEHELDLVNIDG